MSAINENQLPNYSNLLKGNVEEWLSDYHSALPGVISFVKNNFGIKTHLGIIDINSSLPYIHASLIISDLTSLSIRGNGERKIKICPDLAGSKITVPNKLIIEEGIDINIPWSNVGYMQSSEKIAKRLIRELKPALRSKKILIRPDRIALSKKSEHNFHVVNCDPDCSKTEWVVSDQDKDNNILPVKIVSDKTTDIDLSIPYLININTKTFLDILDMNKECICSLRTALSEATRNLANKSAGELNDLRRDIIDPKLGEIERSFKRIVKTSTIKAAAPALATISLSLQAIAIGADGNAINSLLGMGGLGLLMKQYADFKENLLYLKDNPYYLFWKMKNAQAKLK